MSEKVAPAHWRRSRLVYDADLGPNFRDVPGTGGLARISDDGIVISQSDRRLEPGWWAVLSISKSKNSKPFNRVTVYFGAKKRMCQVSRLILESWVGPPPTSKHVAAHRNGVTDDDRLDNLMWALQQDVSHGQICRGTWAHGERAGNARLSLQQVEAARKIIFDHGVSATLLAEALGVPQARVREWLVKTWDTSKWDGLENPLEVHETINP